MVLQTTSDGKDCSYKWLSWKKFQVESVWYSYKHKNWTTHIKSCRFISTEEWKLCFHSYVAWSLFTGYEKVLLVWQRVWYLYRRCTKRDGRHWDRKIQSIDCTDNLTHHMPHWLSSCYQSVCISPTLHGLPVLVNMPHTRCPTAWKRVQRSIKNFLIP